MKILHVIRDLSPETGGPVTAIKGLSSMQRDLGHDVCIVSTDYGYIEPSRELKCQHLCKCTIASWRYAPTMRKIMVEWIRWCDVVHIHTIWEYPTLLTVRLARKFHKPYILRPCGMLDSWSLQQSRIKKLVYLKLFSNLLFQRGNLMHFTTIAERDKSQYPDRLGSIVIGNGLSEEAFLPRDVAKEFSSAFPELTDKKLILFLGRVDAKKQPDVVIKAFADIVDYDDRLHLVIAGPCRDAYRVALENIATELGVRGRVLFTGMLSGVALYGAYRAAALYVLPSHQENFGISVAEAMAGFCPVIVSDQVDIKDVILRSKAGIVCQADYKTLAREMKFILLNPDIGRKMGEKGRKITEQLFRWKQIAEKLDEAYESLLCNAVSG